MTTKSPLPDSPEHVPVVVRRRLFSNKLALVGSTVLAQGLRIGTTLIMARVVSPAEYGLFSLVALAPALITSIGDLGLPTGVITLTDRDEDEVVDTSIVIAAALGLIHTTALLVASICLYYFAPQAQHDWRVIGLALMMGASTSLSLFYNVKLAVLNRRRHFGAESKQNIIFSVVSTLTGIVFGLMKFGAFALTLQAFVAQATANVAMSRRLPLRWPRRFSWSTARKLLSLGGSMSVANYAGSIEARAFEYTVLKHGGMETGKEMLANWGRASVVQAMFSQNVNVAIDRVVYTTMCANADDSKLDRLREIARRGLETLLLLNCFAAAWLFCLAPDLVRLVLGPKWDAVPPILQILALAVPAGALSSLGYNLCLSKQRGSPIAIWTVVRALVFVPVVLLPLGFHMTALAWLFVGGRYFQSIGLAISGWRLIGPPPPTTVYRIALLVCASLGAGLTMHYLQHQLAELPLLLRFLTASTGGLMAYIAACGLLGGDLLTYPARMSRG